MTKEEYLKKRDELRALIASVKTQLSQIETEYVTEHRQFKSGEKVKLLFEDGSQEIVFICGAIEYVGIIKYRFLKCKKDGTPSQLERTIWHDRYTIEKLEAK